MRKSYSIRMDDKSSLKPMFETHRELFGKIEKISAALDKGYFSISNKQFLENETGSSIGLQKPGTQTTLTEKEKNNVITLSNRRAGIEPLIGHAKHGGQLDKSRMKYDRTTESAGYAAILGFNSRQLIRYLKGTTVICK